VKFAENILDKALIFSDLFWFHTIAYERFGHYGSPLRYCRHVFDVSARPKDSAGGKKISVTDAYFSRCAPMRHGGRPIDMLNHLLL